MNALEKTVHTRYGPRQKYFLWFQLWDGSVHNIALHHRSNEPVVMTPNQFICQVVKAMCDAHGTK